MNPTDAFKAWYKTEGIRTPVPAGDHFHEFYQRIAYEAGFIAAMQYCTEVIDKVEKELKQKDS